jgi:hypothetical protein
MLFSSMSESVSSALGWRWVAKVSKQGRFRAVQMPVVERQGSWDENIFTLCKREKIGVSFPKRDIPIDFAP